MSTAAVPAANVQRRDDELLQRMAELQHTVDEMKYVMSQVILRLVTVTITIRIALAVEPATALTSTITINNLLLTVRTRTNTTSIPMAPHNPAKRFGRCDREGQCQSHGPDRRKQIKLSTSVQGA